MVFQLIGLDALNRKIDMFFFTIEGMCRFIADKRIEVVKIEEISIDEIIEKDMLKGGEQVGQN